VKEMPFPLPPGAGRDEMGGDGRPGNPGGGAHDLLIDRQGNVLVGMDKGTIKFTPKSGEFIRWTSGDSMFGLDQEDNVWHQQGGGPLVRIDTSSSAMKLMMYPLPKNAGIYDLETDYKGRTIINVWRDGKIGLFDPKTIEYTETPLPTKMAGPRRGQVDRQNRLWVAEFYAGQVAMFDADKKLIKEYPLINGAKPYTAPYALPYSTTVDDKNQAVWTNDFSSSRIFRIDMNTGKSTEYMTPSNYEVRDLTAEENAPRPTVWLPSYRPPSRLVKIQVR
jgi:streptogramin lyase